ncbi:hypothetical protein CW667_01805 [Candidatus Bathyarchaeota archaeon]|nr:MAG: hypothetical protein CW667_01805 [Candidatus Bathyarchaeota archaeon]
MQISVIIPTYWTSVRQEIRCLKQDAVYDHPTPIEEQGTLSRLLNNLKKTDMPKKSTIITVITAVTHQALEKKAEEKVKRILNSYESDFNVKQFSASTLKKIETEEKSLSKLLSLYGYSNVRNLGLATAQILNSDIIVFLDDDVIVNDREYFRKATEFIGKHIEKQLVGGIAGYYVNKDGNYYLDVDRKAWWRTGWPKEEKMNLAFKVIESKRRLVETTFAFGGNMVLHRKMFEKIPFDPYITRGEDMDLLVNAKMLGFKFLLDTKLKVVHLPGKGKKLWTEMQQDLYRFLYMREKILSQKYVKNIRKLPISCLEPYPGYFLRATMPIKFALSSGLNSLHSFRKGGCESFRAFTRNLMHIPLAIKFAKEHALNYFKFQKKWAEIMPKLRECKKLKRILDGPT